MNIRAYLDPHCAWSQGVRAVMHKYGLSYEDVDIVGDPSRRAEMEKLSRQSYAPCVEIDGVMLADVSGEEVEDYLIGHHLVTPEDGAAKPAQVLTSQTIRFF